MAIDTDCLFAIEIRSSDGARTVYSGSAAAVATEYESPPFFSRKSSWCSRLVLSDIRDLVTQHYGRDTESLALDAG